LRFLVIGVYGHMACLFFLRLYYLDGESDEKRFEPLSRPVVLICSYVMTNITFYHEPRHNSLHAFLFVCVKESTGEGKNGNWKPRGWL